jgi:gluconokinase
VARVLARPNHFFSSSLVDSQFATLEPPVGENGVLRLDGALPLEVLLSKVLGWLPMTTIEKG